MKETTKHCPDCGNTHLVQVRSQNIKLCSDCGGRVIPWYLDEGQRALV